MPTILLIESETDYCYLLKLIKLQLYTDNDGRLCSCDAEVCERFKSCCRNVVGKPPPKYVQTECVTQYNDGVSELFYANTRCPDEFKDKQIRELCATPIDRQTAVPGKLVIRH